MEKFDIIVVGGGHAGIEASYISSKSGLSVLLITTHLDLIAQMSCNPSIGGIAKGNIVREIDALGGIMGYLTDRTGIHFKMLNKTKGMAVWGNRAQVDKRQYRFLARKILENIPNLKLLQAFVKEIKANNGKVNSVVLDNGEEIKAECVILAMGTFLNGIAHIGLNSFPCGRLGEPPALYLTESITGLGIQSGRLKTGTSPRLDGTTINYDKLIKQEGDKDPWPFSFSTDFPITNKVCCWITKTTKETHKIILSNLDRSPLYTGKIKSIGPRYCPSIEDKVVRFGDRDGHTLFLEPEGVDTSEVYLNGLSSSLPFDVQIEMVKSVPGLENAKIIRPAYGIEYDFFFPTQLYHTLESKIIGNLFFAGQINGTSGYEEAACQGLIAGINASAKILNQEPLILSRDIAYIGVLIDDLITKGTQEPYRMFTSRAEHRLILRQDNVDERLMPIAIKRGLISLELYERRKKIWEKREEYKKLLAEKFIEPEKCNQNSLKGKLNEKIRATEFIKRPEVKIENVLNILEIQLENREIYMGIEADIKYSGFIEKEKEKIEKIRKMENTKIPEDFDYDSIKGLLTETKIKLKKIRPKSIGQALRIPGVTPADISVLIINLIKNNVSRETMVDSYEQNK
jgi:tRNA uridine 5-carboxymethylaminomethyl modification enzyme